MKVMVISIGAFGMVFKGLEKRLRELESRGKIKTLKPQQCQNLLEYLEESQTPGETCWTLDFSEKPSAKADVKDLP